MDRSDELGHDINGSGILSSDLGVVEVDLSWTYSRLVSRPQLTVRCEREIFNVEYSAPLDDV
jgi:hypothetical protein